MYRRFLEVFFVGARYLPKYQWAKSGLAAHKEHCKEVIDWDNDIEIIAKINSRSKQQALMNLDYMESLCIKLHRTGPGHGFNEDEGRRVFTKQWDPVLNELRKKERLGQSCRRSVFVG